jgi:hypothetical protein
VKRVLGRYSDGEVGHTRELLMALADGLDVSTTAHARPRRTR